jgi:hypothetical protein
MSNVAATGTLQEKRDIRPAEAARRGVLSYAAFATEPREPS